MRKKMKLAPMTFIGNVFLTALIATWLAPLTAQDDTGTQDNESINTQGQTTETNNNESCMNNEKLSLFIDLELLENDRQFLTLIEHVAKNNSDNKFEIAMNGDGSLTLTGSNGKKIKIAADNRAQQRVAALMALKLQYPEQISFDVVDTTLPTEDESPADGSEAPAEPKFPRNFVIAITLDINELIQNGLPQANADDLVQAVVNAVPGSVIDKSPCPVGDSASPSVMDTAVMAQGREITATCEERGAVSGGTGCNAIEIAIEAFNF